MSKDLTEAMRAIMEGDQTPAPYEPKARGIVPKEKSAAALSQPPGKASEGGSIASPLTETAFADRTFHPQTVLTTPDGFMALIIKPVNKITFTDANSSVVEIVYKAPV